ncbi:MAG: ParA family protein [Chloroflexaceae bacterium]|nr:ParA family protein [Chloroflexaceae bacterium]
MGRVIAVTNIKGGIGKTTTVVNVGAGMALRGARVLLVDVDAQGNLATALGITPRRTMYDVLVDGAHAADCLTPARPNLDVLAADETLLGAQPVVSRRADWSRVLGQVLSPLKHDYDFIFIDSPGSLTVLSVNALMAATEVLVPTTVEHLSIKGLDLLFRQIRRMLVGSNTVRMIVPTMYDSRLRQANDLLKHLQETYGPLVSLPIRINVKLAESISAGRTIFEYDARSRGALDYAQLVECLCNLWKFPSTPDSSKNGQGPASHNGLPDAPPSSVLPAPHSHEPGQSPPTPPPPPMPRPPAPTSEPDHPPLSRIRTTGAREQLVVSGSGGGNALPLTCPHCGHLLRRTTVAGYRVVYCDACSYQQQELMGGSRR